MPEEKLETEDDAFGDFGQFGNENQEDAPQTIEENEVDEAFGNFAQFE